MSWRIFPIGIPAIAGPGTMLAVVLLTDNDRFSIADQATTAGVLGSVLLITLAMLVAAEQVYRIIGKAGAGVISRVTGLILTAIAANNILEAITIYFKISTGKQGGQSSRRGPGAGRAHAAARHRNG